MLNIQTKFAKNQKIYEDLKISRKPWRGSKTGELYYSYLIEAELKGDTVLINFRCPKNDPIGYKNLDRVFKGVDNVYLMVQTDTGFNGQLTKSFCAISFDDVGLSSRGTLLPAATSDRNLLDDVLERLDYLDRLKRQEAADALSEDGADVDVAVQPEGEVEEELIPVEEPAAKGKKDKKSE